MNLTPGQVQAILGLPTQTYRHWRSVLPPIRHFNGHTACFTTADLVALAVVNALVTRVGVRIARVVPIVEDLFQICRDSPWHTLERMSLVIELDRGDVILIPEERPFQADELAIVIRYRPLIAQLRKLLVGEDTDTAQTNLAFPPLAVSSERTR